MSCKGISLCRCELVSRVEGTRNPTPSRLPVHHPSVSHRSAWFAVVASSSSAVVAALGLANALEAAITLLVQVPSFDYN